MACLRDHAKLQPRKTFLLPTDYDINPEEHISLLSQFMQLTPFLVPSQSNLIAPTLRHPDLSLANILLVPGSTKIASVIDWQDASIFPLFMQAGYPAFCEHVSSRLQSLQIPGLPKGLDKMNPQDQIQIKTKFRLEEMNLYYTAATGIHNEEHMEALRIPHLSMQQYLIQQTGYPWDGDVINLRAALVDREKALKESSEWNESEALLTAVRNDLGIDLEGGTELENYDWASSRNLQFRREMSRQAEVHEREVSWRNWPYKDDDGSSSPPPIFD
ncbi:conserved hypothetical protein [Coccidioides posadasii str. Silveira]|uniref:Aminoglycoside phosphotransferase domain-containing protein n=1 Tax=Coccidioides posadasii (strain RMSCC 757 / Silveira) TaxID=443226 RepID=E9D0D7_COCPS|nr:conserved hypothetical protein [Coccidioides posadasii str. Silveira]